MLAAAGGVAGLQIAVWTTEVLRAYFPNLDLSLDPRIALIGLGVALFTGVATGIAPALQSTRPDMALAMKEGSSGAGRPRSIVREGLIVVQVALSVLLLGAGGLLVRSFFMLHRGPGFDPDRVAIVRLRPSLVGFTIDRAWAISARSSSASKRFQAFLRQVRRAISLPARRAMQQNPIIALRAE